MEAIVEQPDRIPPNPSGLCMCGCGQKTSIAKVTKPRRGFFRGEHVRYVVGHATKKPWSSDAWDVIDCGHGSPCWIWNRCLDVNGYGRVFRGVTVSGSDLAHRESWVRHRGPVPAVLVLDHLCRNPPCVNPDHLEPVTQATNSRRGKHAIVTRDMAQQILDLYGVGNHRRRGNLTQEAIAARFGISRDTVIQITTGRHWTIHP
jgi:hypothetical protein